MTDAPGNSGPDSRPDSGPADLAGELAGSDPNKLAGMVAKLSDAELRAVLADRTLRTQVLDEIFRRMGDHFRADKAKGQTVAVHFVITGGPDGSQDSYQAFIKNGVCTTAKELTEHPRATITADGVPFLRLVTGGVGGVELFLKGKLKVGGDMIFAASVAGWFTIPGGK
ncbi:MAG: SCP2 sterol-binding domain-containing protein [Catenulispora sp.]